MTKIPGSSIETENLETTKSEIEATNRRLFTAKSAMGFMAAILVACGQKTLFSGKSGAKSSARSPAGGSASGDSQLSANAEGAGAEAGGASAGGAGAGGNCTSAGCTGAAGTGAGSALVPLGKLIEDKLIVTKATVSNTDSLLFKIYGTKHSALIALAKKTAEAGLAVGDTLHLLQPIDAKTGRILAQHQVFAGNDKDVAHIFDNVSLEGIDSIWVALTRNNEITLYPFETKAINFELHYKGLPVIDPTTVLDVPHPNYYDFMPTMGFSGPTPSVSGDLKQVGSLRPYLVATTASTWATARFQILPAETAFCCVNITGFKGIEMTDAVGRTIAAPSATTDITVSDVFLAKNSTVVLYTNDSDIHWHRYFQFIG